MEFQRTTSFLDITSDNKDLSKFVTKKWIEVYDQSAGNYDVNQEKRIKTFNHQIYVNILIPILL